eukprot:TRINITY_DN195_c1_g1_i4.p1 TRINITY_DN195_c1_g1~~TRINITY_DN195_c1_g1_i4.p1  ORF type:complete len:554 (+),score=214.24 TRINITY_DN195_c1_g1_i4:81-1664(+)
MSTTTSEERLEIFIDDSNLWIEAQRMMAKVTGACKFDPRARVNIRELLAVLTHRKLPSGSLSTSLAAPSHPHSHPIVVTSPSATSSSSSSSFSSSPHGAIGSVPLPKTKRVISHSTIYGSQAKSLPPEAQGVWKHLSTRGLTVKAASRGNKLNREKGIDAQIASDITETIVGSWSPSSVLVLVAGDGDYTPLILKALKRNWKVEVWFWDHSHSKSLSPSNPLFRPFPSLFSFHALDPFLLDIAYLSWNWKGEVCKEKAIVLANIPPNVTEETVERALHEVAQSFAMPDLIPHYERRIDHPPSSSRTVALVFPHIDGSPESLHRLYSALVSSRNPTLSCCSISTFRDYDRKMAHLLSRRSASSRIPLPSPSPSPSSVPSYPQTMMGQGMSQGQGMGMGSNGRVNSAFFEMSLPALFQGMSFGDPMTFSPTWSPSFSLSPSPSPVSALSSLQTSSGSGGVSTGGTAPVPAQGPKQCAPFPSPFQSLAHPLSYPPSQPYPHPQEEGLSMAEYPPLLSLLRTSSGSVAVKI